MFSSFLVLEISLKQSKSKKHLTSFLRHYKQKLLKIKELFIKQWKYRDLGNG
jgi:hypothetical protein